MLKDITTTYTSREKDMNDSSARQIARYREVAMRYGQLMAAYKSLRKQVEDQNINVSKNLEFETMEVDESQEVCEDLQHCD